jgi:dihydrofolate synthase/folylpolyglutamate synthase
VVLERIAAECGSLLFLSGRDWQPSGTPANFDLVGPWGRYRDLRLSLLGQHQVENAATAVAACWALGERGLPVSEASVRAGLASVRWPGRLEVARERPLVVIDAAHNVDSARHLATALRELFHWRRLTLILGIGSDKDVAGIVQTLAPLADHLIATASHHPRAAPAGRIAALARESRPSLTVDEAPSVEEALCRALAEAADDDVVCAAGSLYVAADAREALGLAAPVASERDLLHR